MFNHTQEVIQIAQSTITIHIDGREIIMTAVGRPSKYKKEMCKIAEDLMAEGASKYEVCAELNICFDTISEWCNPEGLYFKQDFSDSIKRGLQLSRAWWEKAGRVNLKDKDFSYTGWYMNMKNRFKWADRQETDITSGGERVTMDTITLNGKKIDVKMGGKK